MVRFTRRHVNASTRQSRKKPLADQRDLQNGVDYSSAPSSNRTVVVVQNQLVRSHLLHDRPQHIQSREQNGSLQLPLTQHRSQIRDNLPDLLRREVAGNGVQDVDIEGEVARTERLEDERVHGEEEGAVAEEAEVRSEDRCFVLPQDELEDHEEVVADGHLE